MTNWSAQEKTVNWCARENVFKFIVVQYYILQIIFRFYEIKNRIFTQIVPPSEVFKSEHIKSDTEDADCKMGPPETPTSKSNKEEPGIPYDWVNP